MYPNEDDRVTVTLTIKQVPEPLARQLKRRAERNRRSLQKEMLSIMEDAARRSLPPPAVYLNLSEPVATYAPKRPAARRAGNAPAGQPAGKLTLDQLWQRARKLGASMPSESAAIIRRDRDARAR